MAGSQGQRPEEIEVPEMTGARSLDERKHEMGGVDWFPTGRLALVSPSEVQEALLAPHTTCSWEGSGIVREGRTVQDRTTFRSASAGSSSLPVESLVEEVV